MQHLTIKAASTATDQGRFSAIAAAWSVDRVGDQILPGAFSATIQRWRSSGKRIPLHWSHGGDAKDIIGWIDPASMREADEGLYVKGQLDLEDSEVAREAWRSMRNNAVSLSFGYLATKERKRKEGVRELVEIDLFEVSIVAHPANPDTRVLEMKAAEQRESDEAYWAGRSEELFRELKEGEERLWREHVEEGRRREEQRRRDAEIERLAQKAAKRARPTKTATFSLD